MVVNRVKSACVYNGAPEPGIHTVRAHVTDYKELAVPALRQPARIHALLPVFRFRSSYSAWVTPISTSLPRLPRTLF